MMGSIIIADTVEEMKFARTPAKQLKVSEMTKKDCPSNNVPRPFAMTCKSPLDFTAFPNARPPPIRINTLHGVELNSVLVSNPGP
mmetsp:Transcript_72556/g.114890  ORF Transcript_72556/g.114890 Transcript_72556/m.114890 type:complete len:85 (+) Transcript_72556:1-255(+)